MFCRWCTSNLKNRVIDTYLKRYKDEGYVEYIGIAADEPKRIKEKCYPLVNWGMTEEDCLKFCYDRGFTWNGLYKHFDRLSCWCCPLKNLKELKILYKYYPELWEQLKQMDNRAYNKFRADYSVEELEKKFQKEENKKC
jgi:3'-phosphoadenosine 5'-phosphosulfate sulfotransferase (PAPS reductase)/FAD synthetase